MLRGSSSIRSWMTVSVVLATAGSVLGQAGPTISRNPGQMVTAGFARAQAAADAARAGVQVTEQPREVFGWGDRSIEIIRDQLVEWTSYFIELLMTRAGFGDLLNFEFDFDGNGVTGNPSAAAAAATNATGNTSSGAVKRIERTPGRLVTSTTEQLGAVRGSSTRRGE